jgi:hypothetical protein
LKYTLSVYHIQIFRDEEDNDFVAHIEENPDVSAFFVQNLCPSVASLNGKHTWARWRFLHSIRIIKKHQALQSTTQDSGTTTNL